MLTPYKYADKQSPIKPRVGPGPQAPVLNRSRNLNIFTELKCIWWTYELALTNMYYSRVFITSSRKYFLYCFYFFYAEKLSFYRYFNAKLIKFCQMPLGLGLLGPCVYQALRVSVKWNQKEQPLNVNFIVAT